MILGGSGIVYLRLLASNDSTDATAAFSTAAVLTEDKSIDGSTYDWLKGQGHYHELDGKPFEGSRLTVSVKLVLPGTVVNRKRT